MNASIRLMLLALDYPIPAVQINFNFCGFKTIFAERLDETNCNLQIPTTFVGAKQYRHNMATLLFQKLFRKKPIDVTLDERCFANSKVSHNDNFCLGLGLLEEVSLSYRT